MDDYEKLEGQLDRERMRLAACSTASIQNTKKTVSDRISKDNPYWSAAYGDVCAAVDREMDLGAQRDHLEDQRDELSIELARMEVKHTCLLEDFQRVDGKLDEARKQINDLSGRDMGHDLAYGALERKLDEARASLDAVKKDLDIANAVRSRLAGELEAALADVAIREKQLASHQKDTEELADALKADAAKLRGEVVSTRKWALGFQTELHSALADAAMKAEGLGWFEERCHYGGTYQMNCELALEVCKKAKTLSLNSASEWLEKRDRVKDERIKAQESALREVRAIIEADGIPHAIGEGQATILSQLVSTVLPTTQDPKPSNPQTGETNA